MKDRHRYKICVISPIFFPSYGGLEQVTGLLAHCWSMEHEVTIVTDTPAGKDVTTYPYQVLRLLPKYKLIKLLKHYEIVVAHNLSLKYAFYMWLFKGKTFVVNHTYYQRNIQGERNWKDKLKLFVLHLFHNISVSQIVADQLTVKSIVIRNPYNDKIFFPPKVPKAKDIVFAGRLVSEKGCIILLKALSHLKKKSITFSSTIIGDGEEACVVKDYILNHGLSDMITLTGSLDQTQLAEELRTHKLMVVPSIGNESFGIVALEGLACGCRMIVSNKGALPEALGGYGRLFQAGNDIQLADILGEELMIIPEPDEGSIKKYLNNHTSAQVSETYIRHFASSL